jgi:ribosomal protein S12 methylthiotransferase
MKKLQILTLGCSKNRVDSEHLLDLLATQYEIIPETQGGEFEMAEEPDVMLVNTCGFIADAKEESIEVIFEQVERKKRGEIQSLIVFGCLSERYAKDLPELIPEVDAWFGVRDFQPMLHYLGVNQEFEKAGRYQTSPSHYAYLKISEGCDRHCSYCAIPSIRGAHRSVPMEVLEKEARMLVSRGVKELILIAQDTSCYGLDLYRERKLAQLLRNLSQIEDLEWIRIHYSYPDHFPVDAIEEIASNPKICAYMDIPIQHISDGVLSNMRRGVNGEKTRRVIQTLRDKIPGLVLRTTLIVGHPGEGEEEFAELLDFVKEARFERLGAFKYSEEEGTYAAQHLEDTLSDEQKQERLDALMQLQSEISLQFNQSRVGSEEEVLVDDYSDGVWICRSRYESPEVDGEILVGPSSLLPQDMDPYCLIGEKIKVKITGADDYDLIAELVSLDLD